MSEATLPISDLGVQKIRPLRRPSMLLVPILWMIILFVDAQPTLKYGIHRLTLFLSVAAAGMLCVAAYHLWKDVDLLLRGTKTEGIIVETGSVPGKYGGDSGRIYFARGTYTVDGIDYPISSEYRSYSQVYEYGQKVIVWYDLGAPDIAVMDARMNVKTVLLLAAGVTITCWICCYGQLIT